MSKKEKSDYLANKFDREHIQGENSPWKPINQAGDFDGPDKSYRSIRTSGSGPGSRVYGKYPGQKKVVVDDINYKETGVKDNGQEGVSSFMVTGKKDGKEFMPQHLDGPVNKNDGGKYEDRYCNEYSECSSSSSARYS